MAKIVLPYDWISIAAVLIVGTALHFIKNKHVLAPGVAGLEKLLKCSVSYSCAKIGYVTATEGMNNA